MKKVYLTIVITIVSLVLMACDVTDGGQENVLRIDFVEAGLGREWLVQLKEKFEAENPGVTVKLEGNPNMTANAGPKIENNRDIADIYFLLETNWQRWATAGYLANLDDLYASEVEDGLTMEEKMVDEVIDFGKINGSYYAIPWNDGVTGIVYNADMFEENNWEVPETFDELLALAETIKEEGRGVKPFTWPGQYSAYWNFVVYNWWAQIEGLDGMKEFYEFGSPEVFKQEGKLKALQAFELLIGDQSNSMNGVNGLIHTNSQMYFINGIAAMIPNGIWIESEMQHVIPDGFRMKMMQTPTLEGAKEPLINNPQLGDFIVVPKHAKNLELAKDFLRMMATDEALMLYTKLTGTPRPFKYDPTQIEGLSEFVLSALEIWKNSKPLYAISKNPMYFANDLNTFPRSGAPYGEIYLGDTTAEEVWQKDYEYVVSRWDEFLKNNNMN